MVSALADCTPPPSVMMAAERATAAAAAPAPPPALLASTSASSSSEEKCVAVGVVVGVVVVVVLFVVVDLTGVPFDDDAEGIMTGCLPRCCGEVRFIIVGSVVVSTAAEMDAIACSPVSVLCAQPRGTTLGFVVFEVSHDASSRARTLWEEGNGGSTKDDFNDDGRK